MTNSTPRQFALPTLEIKLTPSLLDRFWSRVEKGDADTCWEWQGKTNDSGYGRIQASGLRVKYLAHRIAWTIANGDIPDQTLVCHTCDNRRCCNPAHLFLGTHKDNYNDMLTKGRAPSGVDHRAWKLRCKRDHLLSGDNVWLNKQGHRVCKACLRLRDKEYRRAKNPNAVPMAERTHCPQGHPYDESNTQTSNGSRSCRACKRESDRQRYQRNKLTA